MNPTTPIKLVAYFCHSCDSPHTTEEGARNCCPPRSRTDYACRNCRLIYCTEEDADACCKHLVKSGDLPDWDTAPTDATHYIPETRATPAYWAKIINGSWYIAHDSGSPAVFWWRTYQDFHFPPSAISRKDTKSPGEKHFLEIPTGVLVPSWCKWIAKDTNGKCYAYDIRPVRCSHAHYTRRNFHTGEILLVWTGFPIPQPELYTLTPEGFEYVPENVDNGEPC